MPVCSAPTFRHLPHLPEVLHTTRYRSEFDCSWQRHERSLEKTCEHVGDNVASNRVCEHARDKRGRAVVSMCESFVVHRTLEHPGYVTLRNDSWNAWQSARIKRARGTNLPFPRGQSLNHPSSTISQWRLLTSSSSVLCWHRRPQRTVSVAAHASISHGFRSMPHSWNSRRTKQRCMNTTRVHELGCKLTCARNSIQAECLVPSEAKPPREDSVFQLSQMKNHCLHNQYLTLETRTNRQVKSCYPPPATFVLRVRGSGRENLFVHLLATTSFASPALNTTINPIAVC